MDKETYSAPQEKADEATTLSDIERIASEKGVRHTTKLKRIAQAVEQLTDSMEITEAMEIYAQTVEGYSTQGKSEAYRTQVEKQRAAAENHIATHYQKTLDKEHDPMQEDLESLVGAQEGSLARVMALHAQSKESVQHHRLYKLKQLAEATDDLSPYELEALQAIAQIEHEKMGEVIAFGSALPKQSSKYIPHDMISTLNTVERGNYNAAIEYLKQRDAQKMNDAIISREIEAALAAQEATEAPEITFLPGADQVHYTEENVSAILERMEGIVDPSTIETISSELVTHIPKRDLISEAIDNALLYEQFEMEAKYDVVPDAIAEWDSDEKTQPGIHPALEYDTQSAIAEFDAEPTQPGVTTFADLLGEDDADRMGDGVFFGDFNFDEETNPDVPVVDFELVAQYEVDDEDTIDQPFIEETPHVSLETLAASYDDEDTIDAPIPEMDTIDQEVYVIHEEGFDITNRTLFTYDYRACYCVLNNEGVEILVDDEGQPITGMIITDRKGKQTKHMFPTGKYVTTNPHALEVEEFEGAYESISDMNGVSLDVIAEQQKAEIEQIRSDILYIPEEDDPKFEILPADGDESEVLLLEKVDEDRTTDVYITNPSPYKSEPLDLGDGFDEAYITRGAGDITVRKFDNGVKAIAYCGPEDEAIVAFAREHSDKHQLPAELMYDDPCKDITDDTTQKQNDLAYDDPEVPPVHQVPMGLDSLADEEVPLVHSIPQPDAHLAALRGMKGQFPVTHSDTAPEYLKQPGYLDQPQVITTQSGIPMPQTQEIEVPQAPINTHMYVQGAAEQQAVAEMQKATIPPAPTPTHTPEELRRMRTPLSPQMAPGVSSKFTMEIDMEGSSVIEEISSGEIDVIPQNVQRPVPVYQQPVMVRKPVQTPPTPPPQPPIPEAQRHTAMMRPPQLKKRWWTRLKFWKR